MFEEKPDFSTSDLHELHDRKLCNQLMIEQNRECRYYIWDIFTQENYFVWVREVIFHKSRIATKLNPDQAVEGVYDRYDSDYEAEQRGQEANPTTCFRKESCCKKGWLSNLGNIDGHS